jgi:hypothetical protein
MLVGKRTIPVPKTPAMESMALIRDSDCTEGTFALRFRFPTFQTFVGHLFWGFL